MPAIASRAKRITVKWSSVTLNCFRGLNLVTGSQRLHRYEDYVSALAALGEIPETYLESREKVALFAS